MSPGTLLPIEVGHIQAIFRYPVRSMAELRSRVHPTVPRGVEGDLARESEHGRPVRYSHAHRRTPDWTGRVHPSVGGREPARKSRIMSLQCKSDGLNGKGRIGRVTFSKTGEAGTVRPWLVPRAWVLVRTRELLVTARQSLSLSSSSRSSQTPWHAGQMSISTP